LGKVNALPLGSLVCVSGERRVGKVAFPKVPKCSRLSVFPFLLQSINDRSVVPALGQGVPELQFGKPGNLLVPGATVSACHDPAGSGIDF